MTTDCVRRKLGLLLLPLLSKVNITRCAVVKIIRWYGDDDDGRLCTFHFGCRVKEKLLSLFPLLMMIISANNGATEQEDKEKVNFITCLEGACDERKR